jgi:hypothetical protein
MDRRTGALLRLVKLSDNEAIVSASPLPLPSPCTQGVPGGGTGRGEDLMGNR